MLRHWLKCGIAAGTLLFVAENAAAVDNAGVLKGLVKDSAGKPVAGAFVKLRNTERHFTFMVVSKDGGAFEAKDLPAGAYTAEAVGTDMQSKVSAPIAVKAGNAGAAINLALVEKRGPSLPPAWPDH